jgi:HK97 family phage prohead protease
MPSIHRHGAIIGIEDKAVVESSDCWTVTGYASVFNNKDLGGDIMVPGAFKKSLRDHGLPLVLWQHKADDVPVGTCIDAREDRRGLWVKTELPRDDQFVSTRLIPQLKRKGCRGMSIGYKTIDSERRADGVRLLKEVRLYEVSFVNFAMNEAAGVEVVKDLSMTELANALENIQRALNAFRDELQPDRVREIREAAKTMRAFSDEVRRQVQVRHPNIKDPFTRAEASLHQLQARLERIHEATK